MSEMVERVSQAIESIELFSRYNDFTSDAIEGLPVEVCRYCNWGEGQDGENIEVVARFPSGWDVAKELPKMVIERQARAAIEAMRIVTEDDVWLLGSAAEHLRGGSRDEKTRVESAFRIASKLDDLRRRIDAALKD